MELTLNQSISSFNFRLAPASVYIEPVAKKNHSASNFMQRVFDFVIIKRLTGQIVNSNQEIENILNSEALTLTNDEIEDAIKAHKDLIKLLNKFDELSPFRNKSFKTETVSKLASEYFKLLDNLKELEQRVRVLIYPERNEVIFTYDELKELAECQKDWDHSWEEN